MEISTYLSACKLNIFNSWTKFGRKLEIWTKFWTRLVILDGRKMTFWTTYFLCPYS